ncbi:MAG: twin-arginine translocase TatA/TatE family subunit [Candidatus Methylomirabilia bacterium]
MLDIGLQELILIFLIALMVFGPKRLPELGRALGRAMREFRRASDEFRSTIETNLELNEPDPVSASPSLEPSTPDPPPAPVEPVPEPVPGSLNPSAEEPDTSGVDSTPTGEPYVAQRGARLFHTRECNWAARIAEPSRTYFKRVAEAREQGLAACPVCEPWEVEAE